MSFYLDHPFTFPAGVKHKPFCVKYELLDFDGEISIETKIGVIFQDSSGRSRREFIRVTPEGSRIEIIIDDPLKKRSYILDEESKTAFSIPLENWVDEELQFAGEDMGCSIVEGFECRGYQTKLSDGSVMEYWVADDLSEILYAIYTNGEKESSVRCFDIEKVEPEANLFDVPSDYTEGNI